MRKKGRICAHFGPKMALEKAFVSNIAKNVCIYTHTETRALLTPIERTSASREAPPKGSN
jgi:hypothetical protein